MHFIDRYAYSNAVRLIDPAQKGGLALLVILLCLLLDRPLVGLLAVAWMLVLITCWAKLPFWVFARVLLAEGLFLLISVVGVAVSISLVVPAPPVVAWLIGPFWLSTSPVALESATRLLTRALGCASALNFLILTTPLTDLIEQMRRMRLPETLIDLMTIIYRMIFVLFESLQRMSTAQDARLGYRDAPRAMRSAALLGSQLFIDAYRRSQRMQVALESRGMDGALMVLPISYTQSRWAWWLSAAVVVSLGVAGLLQ
ncbi:MAG: cobalt ECF transporter T component CbiQ [Oscillochloris sp.]|nr:cobalt ECF transporter T component CbiQ [Oscillochloris sp.]